MIRWGSTRGAGRFLERRTNDGSRNPLKMTSSQTGAKTLTTCVPPYRRAR